MSNYTNKEREKRTRQKYYEEHKEEIVARARAWNEEHRDEINARRRKPKNETV